MFSERLKIARKAKKMTQEQLAAVIMVERSSVGKYESANVIPSPEVLKRIADALDVSVDYLLERTNTKVDIASTEKENNNTEHELKVALFGGADEVTDEMWEEVKDYAKYIKQKHNKQ